MYVLMSVTRDEMDINESFFATREEAVNAMVKDMILMTNYETFDEIIEASNAGECQFCIDGNSWAETTEYNTGVWKIVKVPDTVENKKPEEKWVSVEWDLDEDDKDEASLPGTVAVPVSVDDEGVSDYLSDKYGFCVRSWHPLS